MSTIPSPSILTQTETASAVLVEHGVPDAKSKAKDAAKPEARVRIARYDQV